MSADSDLYAPIQRNRTIEELVEAASKEAERVIEQYERVKTPQERRRCARRHVSAGDVSKYEIDLVERFARVCDTRRKVEALHKKLRAESLEKTDGGEIVGNDHFLLISTFEREAVDVKAVQSFYQSRRRMVATVRREQTRVIVKSLADMPGGDHIDLAQIMMRDLRDD